MPDIGLDALQATNGIQIPLVDGAVRVRSATVTGAAKQGFAAISAVALRVSVPRLVGEGGPSVTVTVQKSSNGSAWSTAHAFTFTTSGDDEFVLEDPLDYLRVVCTPGGGLREAVVASVFAVPQFVDPPAGDSPGGSQPFRGLINCSYCALGARVSGGDDVPLAAGQGWGEGSVVAVFGQTVTANDGVYVCNADDELVRHDDWPAGTVIPAGAIIAPGGDVSVFDSEGTYTSIGVICLIAFQNEVTIGTTVTNPFALGPLATNLELGDNFLSAAAPAIQLIQSEPTAAHALWDNAGTPDITDP